MSVQEQLRNHGDASRKDGSEPLRCNTCGQEWPCREYFVRDNATLLQRYNTEYERHRAEVAETEECHRRRWSRYERIVVIPLLIAAVLEFGILVGLYVSRG